MDQQENEGELGDNASVEAPDPPQKTPEELAAEAEAAAIERTQQRLQQQCGSVDDAEEVCVFMVQDALNAVFEEMSVSSENTIVFARTSEWASNAVFSGTAMSSMMPQASLDRSSAGDAINAREARQQVLKLNDDHIDNASSQSEPSNSTVASRSTTPSLHLLRRLLEFLESSSTKASLELMGFTDTRYITRKSHTRNHQSTRSNIRGEWEIPCESMARFLEQLVKRCHVRVLPSTLNFVHKSTAALMETKARVNATVTLTQITHFVRKAILTAEEGAPAVAPSEKCKYESRTSWSQQTFQTEVNRRFSGESVTGSFQICFAEEVLPAGASLDRNAPGRIAMKAANPPKSPNQKQLARRVIMAMKPGPKSDSKWLGLRTKLVHDADPAVVQVNIDADMELNLHESPKPASDEVTTLSPKKPPAAPGAGASPAAARRGRSSSKSIAPSSNKERQVVTVSTAEPDTAALSNIFSLGTPRQLSADELSRRNDILAHLEREESQHQRRLANASIAAMTFPPNANPTCSEERAFHAYVAANSSITTGVDFNIQLPIPAAADISNETPPLPAAPRRPEMKNMNQSPNKRDRRSSKQTGGKSKFELACDPPSFAIRDGDTRASDKGDVSPYSPIRKLDSPGKLRSENISLSPVRPGQSPLAPHLPQLDTSRLAVGVRAVVRGVEKRGPRRNPSRQSRLKLHNYSAGLDDEECEEFGDAPSSPERENPRRRELVPHSPMKSTKAQPAPSPPSHVPNAGEGGYLPLIPPVSPTKVPSSPQRTKQVAFTESPLASPNRRQKRVEEEDPSDPSMSNADRRRAKRKQQPVFDNKTASPPRVRNRHFTDRPMKSKKRTTRDSDDSDYDSDRTPSKESGKINVFTQAMDAPRRPVLPSHDY